MLRGVAGALGVAVCLVACSTASSTASAPSPMPATTALLLSPCGSYAAPNGDIFVIARLGWYVDLQTSDYRTIYSTGGPDRFEIGFRFEEPLPKYADLTFSGQTLTIVTAAHTISAARIDQRQTDVTIQAHGATLAATITEPSVPAPRPGIVIVHGSEPGQRFFYDVWVGVYTSLGFTVLTYDKRGNGGAHGPYSGGRADTRTASDFS